MGKKKIFIVLGIFWLLIIGGFIGYKEFTLRSGQSVKFKVVPVDPRDFFRGDYVILGYEFSQIDSYQVMDGENNLKIGDTLYGVIDKVVGGYGQINDFYRVAPKGKVFLKGKITGIFENKLTLEYGIESYFVEAGTGKEIEKNIRDGNGLAEVVIDQYGKAVLKKVLADPISSK